MALSEFETKKAEKLVASFVEKHRPPAHIRNEVDVAYRVKNQSVEIFEIRPKWDDPSEKLEIPVAKTTYVKVHKLWKLYWQRADLKWHSYEPFPEARYLEDVLKVVGEDEHHCFWS